jgi:UDP-N-acetylmuramate--alanine ligase
MVGWILDRAGLDPYVVNGAPVINWQENDTIGNARCGNGDLWVIEADESDRSLLNYHPEYAVVTNMSADHFNLADTVELFKKFSANVHGRIIGALDGSQYLAGVEPEVTAASSRFIYKGVEFELPLPGKHNVEDAMHAALLCELVGVPIEDSAAALKSFKGIHRRLEVVGVGGGVTVIDDYGHNPAKIAAAWKAVVPFSRRGIVIWRPHGFGPLRSMLDDLTDTFSELCGKDDLLLLLPVYDAGGTADRSINVEVLIDKLLERHVPVCRIASHDEAVRVVSAKAESGDVVIVMGARDPQLSQLARRILKANDNG